MATLYLSLLEGLHISRRMEPVIITRPEINDYLIQFVVLVLSDVCVNRIAFLILAAAQHQLS